MAQRSRHWMTVLCHDDEAGATTSTGADAYEAASVLVALQAPSVGSSDVHKPVIALTPSNHHSHSYAHAQRFACDQCNRPFKRKGDLKRHIRRVHQKIRDSICPICSKAFGEDYNMRRHITRVHRMSP